MLDHLLVEDVEPGGGMAQSCDDAAERSKAID